MSPLFLAVIVLALFTLGGGLIATSTHNHYVLGRSEFEIEIRRLAPPPKSNPRSLPRFIGGVLSVVLALFIMLVHAP